MKSNSLDDVVSMCPSDNLSYSVLDWGLSQRFSVFGGLGFENCDKLTLIVCAFRSRSNQEFD